MEVTGFELCTLKTMNYSSTTQLLGLLAGLVTDLDKVDHYFLPETFLRRGSDGITVGISAGESSRELSLPQNTAYRLGFDPKVSVNGSSLCMQTPGRKITVEPTVGEEVIVLMISQKGRNEFVPAMWVWKRDAIELMDKIQKHGIVRIADSEYVYWIGLEENLPAVRDGQHLEFLKPGSETWQENLLVAEVETPARTEPNFMSLARNGLGNNLASLLDGSSMLVTA